MENLKFRRQFIFADHKVIINGKWKFFSFNSGGKEWFINYHPDLNFLVKGNETHSLILLGYILDPRHPAFDNDAILSALLSKKDLTEILCETNNYNGRFVIIYYRSDEFKIFHDATGFREVYYTCDSKIFACGSTPNILAEHFNLQKTKDPEINAFFNSKKFKTHDHTWIGFKTLLENVLHLPPNHYLDLQSTTITRYWPSDCLGKIDINTGAEECAEILKGTIASASNRYKLHMGITAGWDTRLLLAASKELKNDIYFYVNKTSSLSLLNKDIRIPKLLAKKLGFTLNVVDIVDDVSPEFKKQLFENNILANDKLMAVFYNVITRKCEHTYTISGAMGNGLARIYMPFPKGIEISAENIAKITGYSDFKYVIRELDKWCKEVMPICEHHNINIMDLYQWEQENAHWASLTSSEQDIAREEIRPFNNRRLIEIFWSLENKDRYQYYPQIYIRIMRILWKEVLKYPFNPSFKSGLYKFLRFFGIEHIAYYFYKKQKFFRFV